MADAVVTPEPTLSDYIRSENAREQREARGDVTPVEPVPEAPPTEAAAVEDTPSPQEPAEPAEPQAKPDERNPDGTFKKGRSFQAKIDLLTAREKEAQRRADAAEARARELEAKLTPQREPEPATPAPVSAPTSKKPVIDDFLNEADPYAALAEAVADWKVEQRFKAYETQQAEAKAQEAFGSKLAEVHETGSAKYPDWEQAMTSDFAKSFTPPPHLVDTILSSDSSAEALYYLSTHETEARALAAMPPLAAALALGRALTPASAAPSGPAASGVISRAKPPIKPVGASPVAPESSPPDPSKVSQSEWNRYWNKKEREQREAQSRGA